MKNYEKSVGYFFIILGGYVVVSVFINACIHSKFDASLIFPAIFILVGFGLLNNNDGSRIIAIILCCIYIIALFTLLLISAIQGPDGMIVPFRSILKNPSLKMVISIYALCCILLGLVLVVLVHPKTKKHYNNKRS